MERWLGKVAFVTGASAGIGAATVRELVKHGMKVVGIARRIERLQQLKIDLENESGEFYPFQGDVTKESDILEAFKWTIDNLGGVDVLVNNVGIAQNTNLSDGVADIWRKVFDTNVLALCICTREAIKSMKARNVNGHIIHINSIIGHQVIPLAANIQNVYPASKFAIRALAETLRLELGMQHQGKIKVTNLSPGYVKSEFVDSNNLHDELDPILENMPGLATKDIAESIVYALSTPSHVQITELTVVAI